MKISNWGRYPQCDTELRTAPDPDSLAHMAAGYAKGIARGLGRCYGDSAAGIENTFSTRHLDKFISFNPETGVLEAEAGVSLAEIIEYFLPRGWFLPVTPGTKFVTLGGAIASDVHGKNHHVAGTFGQHVLWLDILTAENGVVRCSPEDNSDLFHATIGGHGLTGIILRASVRLARAASQWIAQTTIKAANLAEIMEIFEAEAHSPYSVAWIDCLQKGKNLGRSIMMLGDFAAQEQLDAKHRAGIKSGKMPSVPFDFPSFTLNPLTVRIFNQLYYGKAPDGRRDSLIPYDKFFYPLDAIGQWNRIYGKKGFIQYQFVLPKEASAKGLPHILKKIAASGAGSFLAVLKLFGRQERKPGNISFPEEGYTLALDFPMRKQLLPLLDDLDAIVLDYGGHHYLTKDARMTGETFRKGYEQTLPKFLDVKFKWDPKNKFRSFQSQRLGLGRE